ncbi:terminase [Dactylosporangium sp. CA-139066]|uniref:terminase n=1 Tax=Dactylosporangium sp. CA-139066 TaxID=3239930 RepID=UPI003D938524
MGLYTLGWAVLAWCSKHLVQPDGPDAGQPFRFTPEQVRFVLWLYAIDSRGRWVYNIAVLRRMKGWGKGPMTAALCLVELLGPCRFGGWRKDGQPRVIKHPKPWVQIAAVSEKQTANTFTMIRSMIGERTEIDGIPVDSGLTRIYAGRNNDRKLEPVTTASKSLEGNQISFAVIDEPHHLFETNGGKELVKVCKRNAAKSREGSARCMLTTNAHAPGMMSAAEDEYLAMLAAKEGRTKRNRQLYDCIEAPPVTDYADEDEMLAALAVARGDSTWLDLERLLDDFYDPAVPIEDSIRFYLNQLAASADAWTTQQNIDRACQRDIPLPPKDALIALGFDGSFSDDATVLIGCDIKSGHTFAVKIWEKPDGPEAKDWEVDREDVDRTVRWAFAHWDVCAFFADVHPFESYVDAWAEAFREVLCVKAGPKHSVGFDMRNRVQDFTRGAEAMRAALDEGTVTLGAVEPRYLETLKRHFANARKRLNQYGTSFAKDGRESPRKVDGAAGAVLARLARRAAIEAGVLTKRRRRRGNYKAGGFS